MILQESGENYLETILMLQQQNGSVRSIDIATHMNFTKASVSRAMSILKRENYILMEADGNDETAAVSEIEKYLNNQ